MCINNLLIKKLNAIANNKHYNEMTSNFHANNAQITEVGKKK